MKLNDFYNEVSRRTDTNKTAISLLSLDTRPLFLVIPQKRGLTRMARAVNLAIAVGEEHVVRIRRRPTASAEVH